MAKERVSIPIQEIEDSIRQSAKTENLGLGGFEENIISQVLDSMPKEMNASVMRRWCRDKVDAILANHPAKEQVEAIRDEVTKEIFYRIYETDFEKLREQIEKEKPESVNSKWIKQRLPRFHARIEAAFRDRGDKVDWSFIVSKLGIENIFEFPGEHAEKNFKDSLQNLVIKLEEQKPETFNRQWIVVNLPREARVLARRFKSLGHTNWNILKDILPQQWASIWTYDNREKRSDENAQAKLLDTLEREKPETFSAAWIQGNAKAVYMHYYHQAAAEGLTVNWYKVISGLGKWRRKWKEVTDLDLKLAQTRAKRSFTDAVKELNQRLLQSMPEQISPQYIRRTSNDLAAFFRAYVRTFDGKHVNWDLIVSQLDPQLQVRWQERYSSLERRKKKKDYNNPDEVEKVLSLHRDKLYTVVVSKSSEDRQSKNEILDDLLVLAKRGNLLARLRVVEYVGYTVATWIDARRLPARIANHPDKVRAKIERCIDLYNPKKSRFLTYLFTSLHAESRVMTGQAVEYKDNDGKRNGVYLIDDDYDFYDEPIDY